MSEAAAVMRKVLNRQGVDLDDIVGSRIDFDGLDALLVVALRDGTQVCTRQPGGLLELYPALAETRQ